MEFFCVIIIVDFHCEDSMLSFCNSWKKAESSSLSAFFFSTCFETEPLGTNDMGLYGLYVLRATQRTVSKHWRKLTVLEIDEHKWRK